MVERKAVLVTGASSGIGRGIAKRLGSRGHRVAVTARRRDRLEHVAQDIREASGEALVLPGDVTKREEVERVVTSVVDAWGRIDVLVNNAGIGESSATVDVPDDAWDRQFRTNVWAPFAFVRVVVPHMERQKSGQIVNIGSVVGYIGQRRSPVYTATKWALRGLNECWREELYPLGIKVAYVAPGYVITEFGGRQEDRGSEEAEWALTPDDVAHAVEAIVDQGPNSDVKEIVIQVQDRS